MVVFADVGNISLQWMSQARSVRHSRFAHQRRRKRVADRKQRLSGSHGFLLLDKWSPEAGFSDWQEYLLFVKKQGNQENNSLFEFVKRTNDEYILPSYLIKMGGVIGQDLTWCTLHHFFKHLSKFTSHTNPSALGQDCRQ